MEAGISVDRQAGAEQLPALGMDIERIVEENKAGECPWKKAFETDERIKGVKPGIPCLHCDGYDANCEIYMDDNAYRASKDRRGPEQQLQPGN